jgi:hypothetical protein
MISSEAIPLGSDLSRGPSWATAGTVANKTSREKTGRTRLGKHDGLLIHPILTKRAQHGITAASTPGPPCIRPLTRGWKTAVLPIKLDAQARQRIARFTILYGIVSAGYSSAAVKIEIHHDGEDGQRQEETKNGPIPARYGNDRRVIDEACKTLAVAVFGLS